MSNTIKFNACEHLDFTDNYNASKEGIATKLGLKVCWNRPVISNDMPSLVQFCKLRGRLNCPTSCLDKLNRACHEYKEIEHVVNNVKQ